MLASNLSPCCSLLAQSAAALFLLRAHCRLCAAASRLLASTPVACAPMPTGRAGPMKVGANESLSLARSLAYTWRPPLVLCATVGRLCAAPSSPPRPRARSLVCAPAPKPATRSLARTRRSAVARQVSLGVRLRTGRPAGQLEKVNGSARWLSNLLPTFSRSLALWPRTMAAAATCLLSTWPPPPPPPLLCSNGNHCIQLQHPASDRRAGRQANGERRAADNNVLAS